MKDSKERLFEVMGRLDKTFKKPTLNEELEDVMDTEVEDEVSVEPQEHGEEGPSYKAKLEKVVKHAKKIYEGLPEGELPSWVQDKITLSEDYLSAICSWMHGEEEEKEGDEEGANREMDDEESEDMLQEHHLDDRESQVDFICKNDKDCKKEDLEDLSDEEVKKKYLALEKEMGITESEEKKEKIPVAAVAKVGEAK